MLIQINQAYDSWSDQYDTNTNNTRDLEAVAIRTCLHNRSFSHILEMGCGTGKNTAWLLQKTEKLTAVDFSELMMAKAKEKMTANHVTFVQADINQPWDFAQDRYDLIGFSLVLEHIEDLKKVFEKITRIISPNGLVYIGELHPCRQYKGSQAKFETPEGTQLLTCFTHHISDFITAADTHGFELVRLDEFFDDEAKSGLPRILTLLFRHKNAI